MNSINLYEISLLFKGCTGDTKKSFRDYLSDNYFADDFKESLVINNASNYILYDIEKLLSKTILNISATDLLLKHGYFSWSYVTSHYSNLYTVQAISRLLGNFYTHVEQGGTLLCELQNYSKQKLQIRKSDSSTGSHQMQIDLFKNNAKKLKIREIGRFLSIGVGKYKYGKEQVLRNNINYRIPSFNDTFYNELEIDNKIFKKIIKDNKKSPLITETKMKNIENYSRENFKVALSRLRILTYILNFIAKSQIEYKSYYERNMKMRVAGLNENFPEISNWLKYLLFEWLKFNKIETDEIRI